MAGRSSLYFFGKRDSHKQNTSYSWKMDIPTSGSGLFIYQRLSASLLRNQRCSSPGPRACSSMLVPINIYTICSFKAQRTPTQSSAQLHTFSTCGLHQDFTDGHCCASELGGSGICINCITTCIRLL